MQLFRCSFDNDTSHVLLYLNWEGFCAKRLTFVSIETGYFTGLCNWIRWICPFQDNGAVQLGGHWRALTPCWLVLRWPEQHFPSFCVRACVFVCTSDSCFQSLGESIWQPESSPSPPAVRHLLLFLPHSNSSNNLHPCTALSPV